MGRMFFPNGDEALAESFPLDSTPQLCRTLNTWSIFHNDHLSLSLQETGGNLSNLHGEHGSFLKVKFTKCGGPLRLWSPGVSLCLASPHLASMSLSILSHKQPYQCLVPVASAVGEQTLALTLWLVLSLQTLVCHML